MFKIYFFKKKENDENKDGHASLKIYIAAIWKVIWFQLPISKPTGLLASKEINYNCTPI